MIAVLGVAPNLMAEGPQAANVPSGLAASSSVLAANRPRTEVWNSGSSTADTSHVLFYRDYVLQACAYESALLGGAYGEVTFTTSATTFAQLLQNGTNWSLVICANQGNYSIGTFQSPLVAFHNSHPNTGIIISEWNAAAASTYFPALGFTDVLPKNVYGPLSYTSGGDFAGVNPVQLHSAGWAVWNTGTITGGTVEATGSAASNPMIARNGQVIVNGFLSDTFVLLATGTALVQAEIAAIAVPDTDGDGCPDATDGCPTDPLKCAPGACGCGVADTDTDGDGTADCNDGCPADANKTAPGICGCGVADTDTDGDGVADCKDNCDDLANPNQADCNGNSIGDVCDIASGQSLDCNSNGIPDSCDIASGSSSDRDGDGIPGECEPTPAIQLVVAGSPSCVTAPGSEICYDLQVINPPFGLVAGQFFVEWDTATFALVGVSIGDAPFNSIPYSSANAELGRVFLVASVDNGGAGTSESRTVARLRFQALTVNCSPTDPQVRFMPALPQILTDGQGGAATLPLTNPIPVRIDGVAPVITGTPASITVDADAGAGCASQQTVIPPTASDNCGVVSFTFSRTDGQDISAPFPCGTTTMTWIATDSCGLSTTATSSVTVNPFQAFDFQVQIRGASGNFQRCITFTLSGEAVNYTTSEVLSFSSGIATSSFRVPAGDYDCVIADDRLHTLTQQSEIGELGVVYDTSFTGEKALFSGDLNNDNHIDIVDWGVLVVRIGESASVNTDCSTPEFHADLNADGQVTSVDGQLLLDGMLMNGVTCASGVADGGNGGRQSITVKELVSLGVANAEECDLDHNGLVDLFDMLLWQQNSTKH